jgi:hydrogenase expression/formation protein HypE
MSNHSEQITLAHGGGGTLMQELIRQEIVPALENDSLRQLSDSARLETPGSTLAFTTDSFVVQPIFFPGGDIGKLAVCGTVNDLAARGAKPIALSLAMIIEEGLPLETLQTILQSVRESSRQAGVDIVTGDTKVVERGEASEIFLTTSGVGLMREDLDFGPDRIEPGDVLILNGTIGDHGIAVMSVREGLQFESPIKSDAAPLAEMVGTVLDACGAAVKCMKDPTRGGMAANLNEMAHRVGFILAEEKLPVRAEVHGACEMLGLDFLTVANEGKMIFAVAPDTAENVLGILQSHPLGRQAAIIGHADERAGLVRLNTHIGGQRILDTPYGEELPRIC